MLSIPGRRLKSSRSRFPSLELIFVLPSRGICGVGTGGLGGVPAGRGGGELAGYSGASGSKFHELIMMGTSTASRALLAARASAVATSTVAVRVLTAAQAAAHGVFRHRVSMCFIIKFMTTQNTKFAVMIAGTGCLLILSFFLFVSSHSSHLPT